VRNKVTKLLEVLEKNKMYGRLAPIFEHGKIVRAELILSMKEDDIDRMTQKLS